MLEKNAKELQKLKEAKGISTTTSAFNLGKEVKDIADSVKSSPMTTEEVHEVCYFKYLFINICNAPLNYICF